MRTNQTLRIAALVAVPLALASLATGTVSAQEERNFIVTDCGAGGLTACALRTTFACEWSWHWTPLSFFPYMMYVPHQECQPTMQELLYKNSAKGEVNISEQ